MSLASQRGPEENEEAGGIQNRKTELSHIRQCVSCAVAGEVEGSGRPVQKRKEGGHRQKEIAHLRTELTFGVRASTYEFEQQTQFIPYNG